jgi:exodeoxyribonuclease-5
VPVVAVGDHGQLPPINGNFNLMQTPVLKLEKIHRQAQENPIIKVSMIARQEGFIPISTFSSQVKKYDKEDEETGSIVPELLSGYDNDTLVLCGYNHTRIKLNKYIRQLLEFFSEEPIAGDRIICLRNNQKKEIYNGMLGTIKTIEEDNEEWYFACIDLDEISYSGLISKQQFGANTGMNFTKDRKRTMEGDLFDFGYALTVHKAQGSQARKVILFEERFKQMDDEMWRRWLYTGVTRAEEELYIIGNSEV